MSQCRRTLQKCPLVLPHQRMEAAGREGHNNWRPFRPSGWPKVSLSVFSNALEFPQLNGCSTTSLAGWWCWGCSLKLLFAGVIQSLKVSQNDWGHNNCLKYFPIRYTLNWIMIQLLFAMALTKCLPSAAANATDIRPLGWVAGTSWDRETCGGFLPWSP